MNLEFLPFSEVTIDDITFIIERADVTKNKQFWAAWRQVKDELRKFIRIQCEDGHFYAYRKKQKENPDAYSAFNVTYSLKNNQGLLSYQPRAVSALAQSLINNNSAIDGSDTGLGKTYQALACCREFSLQPLVVCRKAGFSSWWKACRHLGIVPRMIINWESMRTASIGMRYNGKILQVLKREKRKYRLGYDYEWNVPAGSLLIFDEAHFGSNEDSQNSAMWTASKGISSISVSATFADRPSRLKSLFSILNILSPEKFDEWLRDRGNFINQYNQLEALSALSDMKAINKLLYPKYGTRISYDDPDVKKLFPERVIQTEILDLGKDLTTKQNSAYAELLVKAEKYNALGKQAEKLVADLRYRQYVELFKVPVLTELAQEYMYEGKSVIIFVNFLETLEELRKALKTRSLIFGNQDSKGLMRDAVIADFQAGRNKILLCMVNAGGQSISLHDLKGGRQRISLICPTYDPIVLQQVLGRTYRAGTKSTPIMKLVYAAGTVEEKVADMVNRKLANISALNSGDLMELDLFNLGIERKEE